VVSRGGSAVAPIRVLLPTPPTSSSPPKRAAFVAGAVKKLHPVARWLAPTRTPFYSY